MVQRNRLLKPGGFHDTDVRMICSNCAWLIVASPHRFAELHANDVTPGNALDNVLESCCFGDTTRGRIEGT